MTPVFDPDEFWAFSVHQYGKKAVAKCCLALQDDYGVDINLLLLCQWLDSQELALAEGALCDLVRIADHWQKNRLAPLRARRAGLKKPSAPYQAALSKELSEERKEQQALIACINRPLSFASTQPFPSAANLTAYAGKGRFPLGGIEALTLPQRG